MIRSRSATLFLFFLALVPVQGHAQSVVSPESVHAELTQTGVWDSNPLMRTTEVTDLYGSKTTARLDYKGETPRSSLDIAGWADQNLYNQHDFNSTDWHVLSKVSQRTQRTTAALSAAGNYDTTRTSELTDFGLATGLVHRTAATVTPNLSYAFSPLDKVGVEGGYDQTFYDDAAFVDYHVYSLTPSYTRRFSELYSGLFTVRARRYETDDGPQRKVDSAAFLAGGVARITETLSLQAQAGEDVSQEKTAGIVTSAWAWTYVYATDLAYKEEQNDLRLSARRAQQSYSNGNDSYLTTLSLQETHKLNETLALNLGASYQFSNLSADTTASELEALYTGEVGVRCSLTQDLDVLASYKYKNEQRTDRQEAAKQNVLWLGLTLHQDFDMTSK